MKISAFICVTDPTERQDIWMESLQSVTNWADEIIMVCGGSEFFKPDDKLSYRQLTCLKHQKNELFVPDAGQLSMPTLETFNVHLYKYTWPNDWSWEELPKHLNYGLLACTGDWAIRFDADYIFDDTITRKDLEDRLDYLDRAGAKVATFQKVSAVLFNKFYQKGGIVSAINRKYRNICFGRDVFTYSDLCVPIESEGMFDEKGVPLGRLINSRHVGRTGFRFFNYDYTFKTKEFTQQEFYRFSKAHKKYFGETKWGHNQEESLSIFIEQMAIRLQRCNYTLEYSQQPKFIERKLTTITPEQFGYNGWGFLR